MLKAKISDLPCSLSRDRSASTALVMASPGAAVTTTWWMERSPSQVSGSDDSPSGYDGVVLGTQ